MSIENQTLRQVPSKHTQRILLPLLILRSGSLRWIAERQTQCDKGVSTYLKEKRLVWHPCRESFAANLVATRARQPALRRECCGWGFEKTERNKDSFAFLLPIEFGTYRDVLTCKGLLPPGESKRIFSNSKRLLVKCLVMLSRAACPFISPPSPSHQLLPLRHGLSHAGEWPRRFTVSQMNTRRVLSCPLCLI